MSVKAKVWKKDPSDIQAIFDFMVANPEISKVRIPNAYYAWGDAGRIGGSYYYDEIVLVRKFYRDRYQANYWGFRFRKDEHPEIIVLS